MTHSLLDKPQIGGSQPIVLTNISWQTYQSLKKDMGDHRGIRLSYSQGLLRIKMPSNLHSAGQK